MASAVGELKIVLSFDDKNAKKGIADTNKELDTVERHSTAVSAAISAVVNKAVDGMISLGSKAASVVSDSVKAFGDYEQLVGGVETLFGDAAGAVQGYADKAFQTAGLSANDYMQTVTGFSARLLQGLGGDTAKAAQIADTAVTDMADNANKMGSSMQSIQDAYQGFAKQNYTMLDNLKLGYGGTAGEMARLINDSGVLGESMEVTERTINDVSFDKMIEAIHVVQENMGITGTTSKEAATTIQGSVASMRSAWTNMMTSMVSGNGDFDQVAMQLVSAIDTAVANIAPALQQAMNGLSSLVSQVGPILANRIPQLLTDLTPAALELITQVVLTVGQALPSILSSLMTSILAALPGMIQTIASALPPMLENLVNAAIDVLLMISDPGFLNQLIGATLSLLMGIVDAIPKIIPQIIDALPTIINNIVNALLLAMPQILDGAVQMFMAIINSLPIIIARLGQALPQILNSLTAFLTNSNTISLVLNSAIQMFNALIDALPQIIDALSAALPDVLTALVAYLTNPSTIVQVLNAGITLFFALVQAVPKILGALIGAFGSLVGSLWNSIKGMFGAFAANFGNFITGIFKNAINGVLSFIENFVNTPINVLNGFIDVINNVFGAVGVSLGHIGNVSLPRLAQGGYADGATAAIFGEAGKEVALPLEHNTDNWSGLLAAALAEEFEMGEISTGGERPINNQQTIIVNDDMDIRKVGNAFLQEIRRVA